MSLKIRDSWTEFGERMKTEIKKMSGQPYVKVGFPAPAFNKPRDGEPATVGEIAVFNEFGCPNHKPPIPERSFLRSTCDEKDRQIKNFIAKLMCEIAEGKITTETALERLGMYIADLMVQKIDSSVPPPNAPSTIARKGSSTTLIDSGQMRQTLIAQGWQVNVPKR